mmetsp:Transcript_33159/g.102758  ORF Transcript_33159/g.102758 Transcript_33159/m.102758 type:complete len:163 (+) Transcript_33159:926-1414(+)
MIPAGVPAIFVLGGAAAGGLLTAQRYAARNADATDRPEGMLKLGVVGLVVSGAFWCWALLLTLFKGFDLGIVSFALAAAASAYAAGLVPAPLSNDAFKMACGVGYGAVAANYALGLLVVSEFFLRAYFAIALVFWLGMLYVAYTLARSGGLDAEMPTTYNPI